MLSFRALLTIYLALTLSITLLRLKISLFHYSPAFKSWPESHQERPQYFYGCNTIQRTTTRKHSRFWNPQNLIQACVECLMYLFSLLWFGDAIIPLDLESQPWNLTFSLPFVQKCYLKRAMLQNTSIQL